MSRSKVVVFMVVMTFVLGVAIGHAVAGEKVRFRDSYTLGKWEQIEVGDEEGHVMGAYEGKGILTVFEGKVVPDGAALREVGTVDVNTKTLVGSNRGSQEATDKDGDKIFWGWEGKLVRESVWKGTYWAVKGTGKYEGIKGEGTWDSDSLAQTQSFIEMEGEVEMPTH